LQAPVGFYFSVWAESCYFVAREKIGGAVRCRRCHTWA